MRIGRIGEILNSKVQIQPRESNLSCSQKVYFLMISFLTKVLT